MKKRWYKTTVTKKRVTIKIKNGDHGVDSCLFRSSDIVYVPKMCEEEGKRSFQLISQTQSVFRDSGSHGIVGVMDRHEIILFESAWSGERNDPWKCFLPEKIFLHPVKFSNPSHRKPFCEKYLLDFDLQSDSSGSIGIFVGLCLGT